MSTPLAHLFKPNAPASLILLGLLLSAPFQTTEATAQKGPQAETSACTTMVQTDWPEDFTAVARSDGGCSPATLSLTISNANGDIVWEDTGPSDQFFGFEEASDTNTMREALGLWIGDYASITTTGTLPDWTVREDYPAPSEFPFYIDDGVTRERYMAVRDADRLMICFVQGRESMRCLSPTADGLDLETVGVQSFPG